MEWPPILDPVVLERMKLDDAGFERILVEFLDVFLEELFDEDFARSGINYPFARPGGSFQLDDTELGPLTPALHDAIHRLESGEQPTPTPRYPLLAIGANGSPDTLIRKLAALPDPEDRRVLALAGRLHDFDIAPIPRITPYGALPATLVPSPGTLVHCSATWVTAAAFTALTHSEISYHVGRLDPMRFEAVSDDQEHVLTSAYVYVSRWGHLVIDDEPIALAALPADRRQHRAMTQQQLLDYAARETFGRMHTGGDLIDRLIANPRETIAEVAKAIGSRSGRFSHPAWTAYPGTVD